MGRKKQDSKSAGPVRDINKTIGDLGLDPDLDPEIAAQEAAEEVANSAGQVDADTASTVVVDEVERGAQDGVKIDIPPPVVDIPPSEDKPLIPPPKTAKGRTRERTPVASKLGKSIAEKVPGAEKIKVYKREKGQRWFISDYTKADLATFPDFESFLVRYVQPDHGSGEYDLVGVDAANREIELGQIRLKGAPQQSMESGAINLLQQMMSRQEDQAKEHISRMEKMMSPQPQTDPLQLLSGVLQMSDQLREKAMGNQSDNGMSAIMEMMSQSSDKSMQMMMMMMMQQQQAAAAAAQQQQQLMLTLMQPKPDPFMDFMKAKMAEDGGLGGSSTAPLPPPPPPRESTADLITALAGFMAAMGGGGSGGEAPPDDFKDFAKEMIVRQQSEGLGVKEVISLLLAEKNKPGTDDFRHAVDNMAAIMNIANNINRQQEGGPAAGFFDAVGALFGNRDFAGSIANAIRAKTQGAGGGGQALPPNAAQQLALQNQQLRQQLALAHRHTPSTQGAPLPQPPQPHPQPQNTAPGPTPGEGGATPELPANTGEHINTMIEAADEAALVEAVINLFVYYAEFDEWRVFSENFFDHVRRGNKKESLHYIGALFGGLARQNIIDSTLAKKILGSFQANFEAISTNLDDIYLTKDAEVTGDDLLAAETAAEEKEESEDTE